MAGFKRGVVVCASPRDHIAARTSQLRGTAGGAVTFERRQRPHRMGGYAGRGRHPHGDHGRAAIARTVHRAPQDLNLALAIAQLMWGVIQPLAGAAADRYGPAKVLIAGLLVLAIGTAVTPLMTSGLGLVVSLGILSATGAGAGSFSVLIGAASQHLTIENRGKAAGIINAGGSLGQFVFAPLAQALIQLLGWMGAMWSLALVCVGALPLVRVVGPGVSAQRAGGSLGSPWKAVWEAVDDRSYLLLNAGFFTCGFHVAFLVTHLPGEVNLCGLPPSVASWSLALIGLANIVGSLIAGSCTQRFRSKYILAAMYGSRALLIGWYLVAPKTN